MGVEIGGFISGSVLLGNGDGTFVAKVDYGTGSYPVSVAVGDVSGDGKPDLAVANVGSYSVSVLLNNGDETFALEADYGTGTFHVSAAIAVAGGEGKSDLPVSNTAVLTVS